MTSIKQDSIIERVDGISASESAEGLFLMDVTSGYLFKLNHTGGQVWNMLREPISFRNLCCRLAADCGVSEANCAADVADLLGSLSSSGLIQVNHGPTDQSVG
jgi:Coenzyme PQQ synthesis protein D (PqqD)